MSVEWVKTPPHLAFKCVCTRVSGHVNIIYELYINLSEHT